MDKIVKLILARFSSNQPEFFKKIRNWSFYIGLLAAIALLIPVTYPVYVVSILTAIVGICTGVTGGTSLTTKDENIIKETEELFPEKEMVQNKNKRQFNPFKRKFWKRRS